MPTIYKAIVTHNEDDTVSYSNIIEQVLDDELYNTFSWDRLNRLDYIQSKQVIMMSSHKEWIDAYLNGLYIEKHIRSGKFWESPDNILN